MNRCILFTTPLLSFALLVGCSSKPLIDESPLDRDLDPVERPDFPVGLSRHWTNLQSGEDASWEIQRILDDGAIVARSDDGCEWTVAAEWFPQPIEWKECGSNSDWRSGTRTITSSEGELWPLEVGRKATYRYQVTNAAGETASEVDHCGVRSAGRVSVAIGNVDVYRVSCVRRNEYSTQTRTWYWSPEHGEVKYTRVNSRDGVRRDVELLKVDYPG